MINVYLYNGKRFLKVFEKNYTKRGVIFFVFKGVAAGYFFPDEGRRG